VDEWFRRLYHSPLFFVTLVAFHFVVANEDQFSAVAGSACEAVRENAVVV
jgi:hypothetical protein